SDGAATVPLAVLCRQSIAEAMDAQTVLDLTKAGLTFFHALFAYPYPWGKYDSIFVPEYNLGAMENPGLVTFNDQYIFQSAATRHQYEARATTILHEMAHMWFGDLVTPPWWSDLWLKESFADYLGTLAAAEASEFTQAWTSFALARKSRGSADDQRPTTHPIVADIPDVEAASQNFDGITYSKGAAVLKQLAAYVGSDAFTRATRAYFRTHAFGCATLEDLLQALQEASGRHLQSWAHEWLATAGISTITAQVDARADTIERFTVTQSGVDAMTGEPVVRPHRLAVGFYRHEDDQGGIESLTRTHRFEVDLVDDSVDVPEAVGLPLPDLLLLNDDDLTYAIVRLDETSTRTALDRLGAIPEALSRAVAWGALWDACRDGLLSGHDYVDAALHQAGREPHPGLQSVALHRVPLAVERFLAGQDRMAARRRVLDAAWEHLLTAAPGSDAQLTWARILALAASVDDARAQDLRDVLTGRRVVDGLVLSTQLTWSWWTALSATGQAAEPELRRLRELDRTSLAPIRLEQALAARPDAAVKEAVWTALLRETTASNDLVTARVTGWAQAGQEHVRPGRLAAYLAALEPVWHGRGQEIAERILQVAFPSEVDLSDAADGDPINHPVVLGATAWLGAHPDAPRALRSIVIEGSDDVVRALRAQAFTEVTRPRVVSAPSP
ncbi:MAG: aminopeptidase N, partial [Micrococcales bacterium]|nr:aminopeptidase N [Micrococcales bacterium]